MMYYVLLTIILLKPTVDGVEPKMVPGDIVKSSLLGAAETLERCEIAAKRTEEVFRQFSEPASTVAAHCVKLPAEIGDWQGFKPTSELPQ